MKQLLLFLPLVALAACSSVPNQGSVTKAALVDPHLGVTPSEKTVEDGNKIPKGGGVYRVGKAYTIGGKTYQPFEKDKSYSETGLASWYGKQFHGRRTANGEIFDMHSLSAAHRTMPMPAYARVTNTKNGYSVVVRVNDRGPFHGNRVIDLSNRVATLLDFKDSGVAKVKVDYLGRAPINGSDDKKLEATLRTNGQPAPAPLGAAVLLASATPTTLPVLQGKTAPMPPEKNQPLSPVLAVLEQEKQDKIEQTELQPAAPPSVVSGLVGLFGRKSSEPTVPTTPLPTRYSIGSLY